MPYRIDERAIICHNEFSKLVTTTKGNTMNTYEIANAIGEVLESNDLDYLESLEGIKAHADGRNFGSDAWHDNSWKGTYEGKALASLISALGITTTLDEAMKVVIEASDRDHRSCGGHISVKASDETYLDEFILEW